MSVPETSDEEFDFIDFIEDESTMDYHGAWRLYIVRRDMSSDLFGLTDLRTGKATFDEGVVYEMSDEKFLFFLMNFEKHECIKMTNMFEILEPHFQIITGVGENGGYHAQILISSLLSEDNMNEN